MGACLGVKCVYVITLGLALVCSAPAGAQDGGPADGLAVDAAVLDAGARDGGLSDASPAKAPSRLAPTGAVLDPSIRALRTRVRGLQSAATGAPSSEAPLSSLFGIDLRDEGQVAQRSKDIADRIKSLRTLHPELFQLAASSTVATSTETADPVKVWARLEGRSLQLERAYLMQDRELRMAQLEAEQAQIRLRSEQEKAQEEEARALREAEAAEIERAKALEEARLASTAVVKDIKGRRASVARASSQLADLDQRLAKERTRRAEDTQKLIDTAQSFLTASVVSATAAFGRYQRTEALLVQALDQLERSLSDLGEDIGIPDVSAFEAKRSADPSPEEVKALAELQTALDEFRTYAADVERRVEEARARDLESWYAAGQRFSEARFRAFHALPNAQRDELTSISIPTWRALLLELRAIRVGFRTFIVLRLNSIGRLKAILSDLFTLGRTFWNFIKILLIVGFAMWLRRQGPRIRELFHRYERSRIHSFSLMQRLGVLELAFARFAPILLYIITILVLRWALGDVGREFELDLVLIIALWLGYYRLLRRFLDFSISRIARKRRLRFDKEMRAQIESSIVLGSRTFLAAGMLLALEYRIFHDGVLYYFLKLAMLVNVGIVVFVLLRRWRTSIAAAYLRQYPEGALARAVAATQKKSYGLAVVAAAFFYVLARESYDFARETLLQFDQSRKALAFIFRKQLERKAEELGEWEGRIEALPESLILAFSGKPLSDGSMRIDRAPGMEKLLEDVEIWKSGRTTGSYLLRAPRGFGKTTWMNLARERLGADTQIATVALNRRGIGRDALLTQLIEPIGADPSDDLEGVIQFLNDGPRRIILLDDIHRLFLRTIGGAAALTDLMYLIEHSGRHIFWVASADETSWRFITAARPRRARFRAEKELEEWSEEEIRQLLMARAATSGITHQFEDLVIGRDVLDEETLARTSEGYARLIWDYSDGCPWVSLHYWLRSLVPVSPEQVKVRLFKAPEADRLERSPEEAVFLYAAVAMHEHLSAEEAARVLRLPESFAEALLIRGVEEGFLSRVPNQPSYGLSVHWYRTMMRFLRRKHVL